MIELKVRVPAAQADALASKLQELSVEVIEEADTLTVDDTETDILSPRQWAKQAAQFVTRNHGLKWSTLSPEQKSKAWVEGLREFQRFHPLAGDADVAAAWFDERGFKYGSGALAHMAQNNGGPLKTDTEEEDKHKLGTNDEGETVDDST